jgi:phosphatidylglycerol:prolipoprotein diacylglycerol transferase
MSIDQIGIHIGPLYIRFYALALMSGIIAAGALIAHRAKRHGQDPEHVWNGIFVVALAGIIGARLYHVLTPPPSMGITVWEYLTSFEQVQVWSFKFDLPKALATWEGGLGVPGALIGGALAVLFYARRYRLDFWLWGDLIAPAVALGQAIGRWGNYFNQELYGKPTDLPWAVTIRPENRVAGYETFARFHPMFLYEMIMNLLICGGLIWIGERFSHRLRSGDLLGLYAIFYFSGRFFLEYLKLDAPALSNGPTVAQVFSLVVIVGGLAFLVLRHRWMGAVDGSAT